MEAGEDVPRAIRRELLEELEVTPVFIGRLLDVVEDSGSPFSIEFHEVAIEGEPQCREHAQLAWVARAELAGYPLAPSDAQFVARTLGPS